MPVYIHNARLANNENHPGLFKEGAPRPVLETDLRYINCPVCAQLYENEVMGGNSKTGGGRD
jgi:hypothetical protein